MFPQPHPKAERETKKWNRAPRALRLGLLVAARVQDHLHQMEARFHLWIAVHTLIGISCLVALTLYFLWGRCCT